MGRTIGYLRVSTIEQDLEKNKDDILKLANEKTLGQVEWVEEKVSGVQDWRKRKLGEVLPSLKKGDAIIVSELSRFARSMFQVLEIMKVAKENDVAVYAVKNGWSLNGSMESKIVLAMLSMFSEIERDLISERTKEGLRARAAAGVKLGRPKGPGKSKLDKYRPEIEALLKNGSRQSFIAKRYGTTPLNLANYIRRHGINKEPVLKPEAPPPVAGKGGNGNERRVAVRAANKGFY